MGWRTGFNPRVATLSSGRTYLDHRTQMFVEKQDLKICVQAFIHKFDICKCVCVRVSECVWVNACVNVLKKTAPNTTQGEQQAVE